MEVVLLVIICINFFRVAVIKYHVDCSEFTIHVYSEPLTFELTGASLVAMVDPGFLKVGWLT